MVPLVRRFSFYRNSRSSFLIGASWAYHPSWPRRHTHIYLGLFVFTITTHEKDF